MNDVESPQKGQLEQTQVRIWLWVVYSMIFCMVVIGGITRLTGSGLSMVEWRPLMGTLPPLSQEEWGRVFELYKQSPQYQEVNTWMNLGDFKHIFFWEYLHRLFGRLIGLVFGVPWLYFIVRKKLKDKNLRRTTIALMLGGSQGLLGWYMVKSGLVDRPEVSHLRLAAHLSLAFFVGMWVFWSILALHPPMISGVIVKSRTLPKLAVKNIGRATVGFLLLLGIQIVYGAFMAGTRAGYMYQTFPTLNGAWIAPQWGAMGPWWVDVTNNPDSIHFLHRSMGWLLLLFGGILVKKLWSHEATRWGSILLGMGLMIQFALGVATIVFGMPISIAAAHQGGAFLLLSITTLLLFVLHSIKSNWTGSALT